tara:strand:- start:316 stop:504 length:189 start_codon:yes stop_codon:yes gene_type:complete
MGLSIWQILIIVVVIAIFLKPQKIPELGKSFAQALKGFKSGLEDEDQSQITEKTKDQDKTHS